MLMSFCVIKKCMTATAAIYVKVFAVICIKIGKIIKALP